MKLLILFSLFTSVMANCCLPEVFQGSWHVMLSSTSDDGTVNMDHIKVDLSTWYDYKGKVSARQYHYPEGGQDDWKIICNFNEGQVYLISDLGTEHEKCTFSNTTEPMARICVPAEAKQYDSVHYGAGEHTVKIDRYVLVHDPLTSYFSLEQNTCVPIDRGEYNSGATDNVRNYLGGNFLDFLPEIADRAHLTPPEHCTPGSIKKQDFYICNQNFYRQLL